jgi:hypothetical protein
LPTFLLVRFYDSVASSSGCFIEDDKSSNLRAKPSFAFCFYYSHLVSYIPDLDALKTATFFFALHSVLFPNIMVPRAHTLLRLFSREGQPLIASLAERGKN